MKNLKYFSVVLIIFWGSLIAYSFISSVPVPTNESFKSKTTFFSIIPQGWGFFTRNPREVQLIVYEIDSNEELLKFTNSNSGFDNYYGASRKNRMINLEVGHVESKIKGDSWINHEGEIIEMDKSIKFDTIQNLFQPSFVNGKFLFIKQERTPWAWGNNFENIIMPYKYAKVYVKSGI